MLPHRHSYTCTNVSKIFKYCSAFILSKRNLDLVLSSGQVMFPYEPMEVCVCVWYLSPCRQEEDSGIFEVIFKHYRSCLVHVSAKRFPPPLDLFLSLSLFFPLPDTDRNGCVEKTPFHSVQIHSAKQHHDHEVRGTLHAAKGMNKENEGKRERSVKDERCVCALPADCGVASWHASLCVAMCCCDTQLGFCVFFFFGGLPELLPVSK